MLMADIAERCRVGAGGVVESGMVGARGTGEFHCRRSGDDPTVWWLDTDREMPRQKEQPPDPRIRGL